MKNTKQAKQKAREFFKKHKYVYNPALRRNVIFNSKGLSHLFYKGAGKVFSRPEKEIITRVQLLGRALKILQKATYFQEDCTSDRKWQNAFLERDSSLEESARKDS